jgi:hypothetical protein
MGTFYTHGTKETTWKDFIYQEIESETCKILQCSIRGRVAYLACQVNTGIVFGLVLVLETLDGQKGYRPLEETCGPLYHDCPANLIRKLSPTDNENALNWRQQCLQKKRKPKVGDRVRFACPVSFFDGRRRSETDFVVVELPHVRGLVFKDPNGGMVKIRNIQKRDFSILTSTEQ